VSPPAVRQQPTAAGRTGGIARGIADEAIAVLRGSFPDGAAEIARIRSERPDRPTVVVVGETKRGKSSLVNALLNRPGLSPVDAMVATSTYLVFRHGEVNHAAAVLPGAGRPVTIPIDRLRDWATELGELPEGQPPPRMVEVECTAPLLTNLTLIDTPGVGGLVAAHAEIALHAARQATALLFVVDASAPFARSELDFLRTASESIDLVLFAVTKIDAYRGWRQIVETDRALLRTHAPRFADAEMMPVSSQLFERAVDAPAPEVARVLRTESQVIGMQIGLQSRVAAKADALHDANVLRGARSQLAAYFRALAAGIAAVDPDPAKVAQMRADRERLVAQRRSDARTWQLTMRAQMGRARTDSMLDVQREVRDALHRWRIEIDRADRDSLKALPREVDAVLQATTLRVFDRILGRLRSVTEVVLHQMFAPDELEDVYAGLARAPTIRATLAPPEARQQTVEDKIVMFGGVAAGLSAGRLVAFVPAMLGAGAASVVMAPVSIGLGLAATTWMVFSRRRVAEKNHLKVWIVEAMTEARASLESEVASQFIDAEHTLTLALDAAVQRRVDALDAEVRSIDAALKLDAQQKDRRRQELLAKQAVIRQVVAKVDTTLQTLQTSGHGAQAGVQLPALGGGSA